MYQTSASNIAQADLFLKPSKCMFDQDHIEYLGLIIQRGQTSMDPVKVQGIQQWPKPKNIKDIHTFLGFCNFYCQFVTNYACLTKLLIHMTESQTTWHWEEPQDSAFKQLKLCFQMAPVLHQPD